MSNPLTEATEDTGSLVGLTGAQFAHYRALLLSDPFIFAKSICRHDKLVARFHAPIIYLVTGCVDKLVACLSSPAYDSEFTRQVKSEFKRMGIEWWRSDARQRVSRAVRKVNLRMSRAIGKSTVATVDAALWLATVNPNETIGLCSFSDPGAEGFCRQIGDIIASEEYQYFFGDRVGDLATEVNKNRIWLKGRTRRAMEWTIEARGISGNWTRTHYNTFFIDDIVGTESKEESDIIAAREWMAAITGITIPEIEAETREIHVGTVYGPDDDHAVLSADPNFMTIVVPIWVRWEGEKRVGASLKNIKTDGVPVLPEWYSLEKIQELRQKVLSDPEQGPMAWLQNYELTAADEGSALFPRHLLDSNQFEWVEDRRSGREFVRRGLRRSDGRALIDPKTGLQATLTFDPVKLFRVFGVDVAVSKVGDEWAITCIGADKFNVAYQLETRAGQGLALLIDVLEEMNHYWNPAQIGMEKAAQQEAVIILLQKDPRYRNVAGRIIPVGHGNIAKPIRLRTQLASRLVTGDIVLNPRDLAFRQEAVRYRSDDKRAKDNRLDSMAIGMTLLVTPSSGGPEDDFDEDDYEGGGDGEAGGDWLPAVAW